MRSAEVIGRGGMLWDIAVAAEAIMIAREDTQLRYYQDSLSHQHARVNS